MPSATAPARPGIFFTKGVDIAKSLDFGVVGVMISTIICIAPGVIFSRIQFKKIISETAKGIWNQ